MWEAGRGSLFNNSTMNYIELIRTFWRSHEEHSFSTTEIALYFYLVEVSNICRWKNPFKRNNSKIMADLSISFNTLKNARNKLSQCELISFKSQSGNANVTYSLSNFDEVANEVDVKAGDEVECELTPTKIKQNKNKTKTILYPYQGIVDLYNSTCVHLPKIKSLTPGRKKKISARLDAIKNKNLWISTIETVFLKVNESTFMRGENRNGWRATFDWIFENDQNIIKILEGNYDNRTSHTAANRTNGAASRTDDRRRELEHLEDLCQAVLQYDISP